MPFVLDASVTAAWAFKDETTPYTEHVMGLLDGDKALAPPIWPLEVTNVLIGAERRERIKPARTTWFLRLIRSLPITVVDSPTEQVIQSVVDLARGYELTTYDASYLELAMREALPLATLDEALRTAASRAGVSLV